MANRPDQTPARGDAPTSPEAGIVDAGDYPLFVVTGAAEDGERSGCLAGFVTQCSIRPPRFLICVSKLNHTFAVAERSARLGLHLLGQSQRDMAVLFGATTDDTLDKFTRCRWAPGPTGVPILEDCAAWVEGSVLEHHSTGDHEAFLITSERGGRGPAPGMLTYRTAGTIEAGHPAA